MVYKFSGLSCNLTRMPRGLQQPHKKGGRQREAVQISAILSPTGGCQAALQDTARLRRLPSQSLCGGPRVAGRALPCRHKEAGRPRMPDGKIEVQTPQAGRVRGAAVTRMYGAVLARTVAVVGFRDGRLRVGDW
jgi:hypothetical protein